MISIVSPLLLYEYRLFLCWGTALLMPGVPGRIRAALTEACPACRVISPRRSNVIARGAIRILRAVVEGHRTAVLGARPPVDRLHGLSDQDEGSGAPLRVLFYGRRI